MMRLRYFLALQIACIAFLWYGRPVLWYQRADEENGQLWWCGAWTHPRFGPRLFSYIDDERAKVVVGEDWRFQVLWGDSDGRPHIR